MSTETPRDMVPDAGPPPERERPKLMPRIVCIVGTRPEVIKMVPVIRRLRSGEDVDVVVLLTGQHRELVHQSLGLFGMKADWDLDLMVPNQTLGELTARAFAGIGEQLKALRPDMVVAQGDTTTVMVAAVASFYAGIPFAHVEAGLRTGDLRSPFPEEFNRIVAGRVATLHFAPTQAARQALLREGVDSSSVTVTGNTVIDTLADSLGLLPASQYAVGAAERLILMTSHRRENFGEPMRRSFETLRHAVTARQDLRLLYPVHPNPNVRKVADDVFRGVDRIRLVEPLDYFSFAAAMKAAYLIVTDSGGVQEEAPWLGKPVLVLREETERPEAVTAGVARLVGAGGATLAGALDELLDQPDVYRRMAAGGSPYGDGKASLRIVQRLRRYLGLRPHEPCEAEFGSLAQV